ncbi:CoA transferase [Saccharomonospora xinjiangensis]|uniref:Putative acyl-CoA transferase/carnitine dehydratase n=1 Tax=Saccharomonospora xinjiangensis XJ-54 TaxID=882086 RepID=I0V3F9_9PSEU|nr:CoA transferase [Saccharomonospora xinjiangensis]EID54662.1 putative acyl-CoA transferase/carnitine dehydratase [Saccharomonospora xinjiangensis XJ-54]
MNTLWAALDGDPGLLDRVECVGNDALPSSFPVSELATAAVGVTGCAVAELLDVVGASSGRTHVHVDRAATLGWFGFSLRPDGWQLPALWDPIAGNYRCADGWIRLHTNVPAHRQAALDVLDVSGSRDEVAKACRGWHALELEERIVARGGCAGAMRSRTEWLRHPQGRAIAHAPLVERILSGPSLESSSEWAPSAQRPLAGLRVLDLTRVLAGPVATRTLAGLGATVLRLDPPDWAEPGLVPEVTVGKRCARIDFRTPTGRTQVESLLAEADVIVHGLRPGALERAGLDAQRRQQIRPGLVDVSLSAYGWAGPWAHRRGFDSVVQLTSGLAAEGARRNGTDGPSSLPVQALDHAAGWLLAAATLRGLAERHRGRGGVRVRTSLAGIANALAEAPPVPAAPEFDPASVPDCGQTEQTDWGPARRMVAPFAVTGAATTTLGFDRGAVDLGHDEPAWVG